MEDQAGIDPLLPLNEVAWGLHKSTRRVRELLAEQSIPVIEFSPRERYVRHSGYRQLLASYERPARSESL